MSRVVMLWRGETSAVDYVLRMVQCRTLFEYIVKGAILSAREEASVSKVARRGFLLFRVKEFPPGLLVVVAMHSSRIGIIINRERCLYYETGLIASTPKYHENSTYNCCRKTTPL